MKIKVTQNHFNESFSVMPNTNKCHYETSSLHQLIKSKSTPPLNSPKLFFFSAYLDPLQNVGGNQFVTSVIFFGAISTLNLFIYI